MQEEGVGAKEATAGVLGNLPLIEAPYTVNVLSEHLLDIQQSARYIDYLKNVPAANVGNVVIGFFSLRGFAVGTDGYLYDGLPGHAALSETYQLDSFERIEVFKGPSAFLNGFGGSSSLGGTLNYVPKRAPDDPLRAIEVDYTNRALFSVGADLGYRFGADRQFGVRLNARVRDGEQQAERYDWRHQSASVAFDWDVNDDLRLLADVEYAKNRLPEIPPFFAVAPGIAIPDAPDASKNVALGWDDVRFAGQSAYLRADWTFAPQWTLTAQVLSSETRRPRHKSARFGFILNEAGDAVLSGFEDQSKITSDSGQLLVRGALRTASIEHQITLGVSALGQEQFSGYTLGSGSFFTNLYRPVDSPEPAALPSELQRTQKSDGSSFLVSDIVSLGERWSTLVAARHAKYSLDNFSPEGERTPAPDVSKTSPTAALMFKPLPGSLLYVSYAEGLEQGGTAPLGTVNSGERLDPLITEQYELGAKLERGGVTYAVALFDLMRPSEFVDAQGRFVQDGEQRHRGLEASATGRLSPNLEIVAGAAYLDPENEKTGNPLTEGKRPPSVPRYTANLFADYQIAALPGLFVNVGVYHNAEQYLDGANTQQLDAWTRLDLGARYETGVAGMAARFMVGIENVTDEDYWIGQNGILTIADPLTLKVTARLDF